jgi:RNA polymerase sigma-70 factor (ECF subfamily)
LLRVLDPSVVLRADAFAVKMAAAKQANGAPLLSSELRGADNVATALKGRAGGAQPALINGVLGTVWAPGGKTRAAFRFTVADEKIVAIEIIADPQSLGQLDVSILSEGANA